MRSFHLTASDKWNSLSPDLRHFSSNSISNLNSSVFSISLYLFLKRLKTYAFHFQSLLRLLPENKLVQLYRHFYSTPFHTVIPAHLISYHFIIQLISLFVWRKLASSTPFSERNCCFCLTIQILCISTDVNSLRTK
jgi:hypothetical protein